MPKKIIDEAAVERMYLHQNLSLRQIADKFDTHHNRIFKILKDRGCHLRTRSEAQKNNLAFGGQHPTKGKKRTQEEKIKIAQSVKSSWDDKDDEEKKNILKPMRQALAKKKKQDSQIEQKAKRKMLETKTEGSRLEKYIFNRLKEDGYKVSYHVKQVIANDFMEYDLFLSMNKRIVIEIDGPTHQRAIFGEERLQKQRDADNRKNTLTISQNIHMIRVFADYLNLPLWKKDKIYSMIVESVEKLNKDEEFKIVTIGEIS